MKKINDDKLIIYASVGIIVLNFMVQRGITILEELNPHVICEFTKPDENSSLIVIDDGKLEIEEMPNFGYEPIQEGFKRALKRNNN